MKSFVLGLRAPAFLSFLLVLPFIALEFAFNSAQREGASGGKYALDMTVLFGILWMLSLAFIAGLLPVVRSARSGAGVLAHPVGFVVRVAVLAALALVWVAIVADQMPAFLGMPNAD